MPDCGRAQLSEVAARTATVTSGFWVGRQGTAAGLLAVNEQFGAEFYAVPPEAVDDPEAADEALGGDEVVIDVQTHYVADRDQDDRQAPARDVPQADAGVVDRASTATTRTASPSTCAACSWRPRPRWRCSARRPASAEHGQLYNEELAATRRLLRRAGPARSAAQPRRRRPHQPQALESMGHWVEECAPAAWKVYTLGEAEPRPCDAYVRTQLARHDARQVAQGLDARRRRLGRAVHGSGRGARPRRRSAHHLRAQGHQRAHRHRQPGATSARPRRPTPTSASSPTTRATRSPTKRRALHRGDRPPRHQPAREVTAATAVSAPAPTCTRSSGPPGSSPRAGRARPRTCSARCCSRWARTTCCGAPTASGTGPRNSSSTRSARSRSRSRCRRSSATPR